MIDDEEERLGVDSSAPSSQATGRGGHEEDQLRRPSLSPLIEQRSGPEPEESEEAVG